MFTSIPSLGSVLQCLLPVFTQPSFQTHIEVLLGWVMCLSKRTEYGVFQTIQADTPISRKQRHPFDRFYNFFSRSAWTVRDLAHQIAVAVVVRLSPRGLLYLVVDDTLLHKHGKHVWALGWFRDAAASTPKRTVIASGNHWVVMGLAICIPGTNKIYCLPIHAKLHRSGKGRPGEAALAKEMLDDVLAWFPDRKFVFLGDGAYSAKKLLGKLDSRITYIGVMRGDAAIYDPQPRKGHMGRKPSKGPRLPNPREAVKKADRGQGGPWAVAHDQSHRLWDETHLQDTVVRGGLAWSVGLDANPSTADSRSAWQAQRRLLVHDRLVGDSRLGHRDLLATLVDRSCLQSQQAGDAHRIAAALVPPEHREAFAVGVADAEHDWVVVPQRRAEPAPSPPCPATFGQVGHRMVASSHAPRTSQRDPGTNNYRHVGHESRPTRITATVGKLPNPSY